MRYTRILPYGHQYETITVGLLEVNDIIMQQENGIYDTYSHKLYKVIRINKKTITVQECDENGRIHPDSSPKRPKIIYENPNMLSFKPAFVESNGSWGRLSFYGL
jgi:hypothetical protein